MKKKSYGTVLVSMLLVGAVVGWTIFDSDTDPQPAVEYRAVCRNLPTNAHWTDGSTRKEIPQTETSPNVREPSPVGTYGTSTGDTTCHFICDDGYGWNGTTCDVVKVRAACETEGIEFSGFTIAKCNVGATVAGTGKLNGQDGCETSANGTGCWSESIGDYFQRGNNYGFANSGALLATTSTQPDTSGYGPNNPYSSGIFIVDNLDWSSSPNDNLRGGSSDGSGTIPTNGTGRQGPCLSGYHVPSMGERNQLLIARAGVNNVSLTDNGNGYYYFSNETNATKFRNYFLLPLAGSRNYDSSATVYDQGYRSHYWSSSPTGSYARYLYLDTSYVNANSNLRAYGYSLRCFKD